MLSIRRNHKQSGFTLMELLIVIAILGLLLGMLIPRLGGVTDDTVDTVCDTNNKGIRYFTQMYYNTHGSMPNGLTNLIDATVDATAITDNDGIGQEGLPLFENPGDDDAEVIAKEFYDRNIPMLSTLDKDEVDELAAMGIHTVYNFKTATGTMERKELASGDNVMMMGIGTALYANLASTEVGNPEWLGRIMMAVNNRCDLVSKGMIQASALCPGAVLNEENFTAKEYVIVLPRLKASVKRLATAISTLDADEEITYTEANGSGAAVTNGRVIKFNFSAQEPWQFDLSCPEGHKWPDNDQDAFVHTGGLS